jgi:hypothetical protein
VNPTDPQPLTAAEINDMSVVEIIMTAPLDQAVTIAVGRASTCWTDVDGSFGIVGVFDDATAIEIVNALLARISAELAGAVVDATGQDRAQAMIPTLAFPTEARDRQQCGERLRIEGHAQHSQCLLLAGHDGEEHQNGNLRWRKDPATGEITAWWDTAVYETVGLGELLRSGVYLTVPHLPADAVAPLEAEPDETVRITYKSTAEIEGFPLRKSDDPQE